MSELDETLADWERRMILDALAQASGIQARAAKLLGISERNLWYRVKNLKIPVPGGGGRDRACMSVLTEAVGWRLEEAFDHAGIPFPERVVYGQERAPR